MSGRGRGVKRSTTILIHAVRSLSLRPLRARLALLRAPCCSCAAQSLIKLVVEEDGAARSRPTLSRRSAGGGHSGERTRDGRGRASGRALATFHLHWARWPRRLPFSSACRLAAGRAVLVLDSCCCCCAAVQTSMPPTHRPRPRCLRRPPSMCPLLGFVSFSRRACTAAARRTRESAAAPA